MLEVDDRRARGIGLSTEKPSRDQNCRRGCTKRVDVIASLVGYEEPDLALDEWSDVGEPQSDDKGRRVEDSKQQTAKERKHRRSHSTHVSISLQLGSGAYPEQDAQQAKNDRHDRESVQEYADA